MRYRQLSAETRPDLGPGARLNRVLPWLIGMGVLGLVLVRYLPQIHKNEDMRRQLQQKVEETQRLELEVSRLRAENNALTREPRTIERTAREQLSFARPEERVVTFQEPLPPAPAEKSASDRDALRRPAPFPAPAPNPAPAPPPRPGRTP